MAACAAMPPRRNCAALVRQVMRSLAEGDADLALWKQLDVPSPLYTCALQLPRFTSRDHSRCRNDHWILNFPKGLDAFFMSLGSSQRSKLRRKYLKRFSTVSWGKCKFAPSAPSRT